MKPSTYCTHCGAVPTADAAFCEQCGQRVEIAAPPPPSSIPKKATFFSVRGMFLTLFVAVLLAGTCYHWITRQALLAKATHNQIPSESPPPRPTRQPDFPKPPPAAEVRPPVEVAYIHFLDQAHRRCDGKIKVGSPTSTAKRIEVDLTTDGERHTVVVLEQSNDAATAVILIGPKDAGAILTYTLQCKPGGWEIGTVVESDG